MKALGLALVAALAIGCSSTPTSPSSSEPAAMLTAQDVKPIDHIPGTQSVTIIFFPRELAHGYDHVVGLPVHLTGLTSGWQYLRYTGKQGTVSADFPKNETSIHVESETMSPWCGEVRDISLPFSMNENRITIHTGC